MDIVGHIRGIPGLFVAAVFSSSLRYFYFSFIYILLIIIYTSEYIR